MGNTYNIGDRVLVWWRGEVVEATVIEILRSHCYRVRLTTGEVAFRTEGDLAIVAQLARSRQEGL